MRAVVLGGATVVSVLSAFQCFNHVGETQSEGARVVWASMTGKSVVLGVVCLRWFLHELVGI